jgi:prepilin-type N-terminal cleavage/methylation domain-containing protein
MNRSSRSFSARLQSGFTLVEIAIVLLIVGLLLGGVLKGQELISSAKVSNLAQSVNGYQAAVLGFQDRYRFLPGDSSQAAARVGSGAVNCATACDNGQINPWPNTSLVNNHLSASGFYKGAALAVETNAQPTSTGYQTNSAGGIMFVAYWSQFPNNAGVRGTLNRNGVYTGSNMNSRLLGEFDRKVDDGNAWTGSVREAWPGNAACAPGGAWLEDNAREDCASVMLY